MANANEKKPANSTERLLQYKSVKDVPAKEIFAKSADGKTLVLNDGTKVSDELIAKAQTEQKAKAAAVSAAEKSGIDLDDPEFVAKVHAIATDAAQSVLNATTAKK